MMRLGTSSRRMLFFQAEDGIRDVERSRGLGDVYKRQSLCFTRLSATFDLDTTSCRIGLIHRNFLKLRLRHIARCGNTLISTVHSAGSCNFCFHPGQADCFYRKTILRCVSSFSAAQAAAGRRLSAISMVSVFKFFGKQPAVSQFKKVHIVEASHLPVCVSTRTAFA